MLRIAVVATLVAFAVPAAAQYAGTYATENPAGNNVTLTLRQDAQGKVTGTLSGNGASFKVDAAVQQGNLKGTVKGEQGSLYLIAQLEGASLNVLLAEAGPGGQPNLQRAQYLVMAKASPGKQDPPSAGAPTDEQAAQFLTANAWCGFTYNQRTGTSTRERVVFGTDGWVARSSGAETYSSGYGGTVAGQYANAERARWRVRSLQLELSQDGANWAPQPLEVTRNSSGSPIVKSGGREYMVCR